MLSALKGVVWRFCTFYKDISGIFFLLQNKIQSFQNFNMVLLTTLAVQKKFFKFILKYLNSA